MKPARFEYIRPSTVTEALDQLVRNRDDGKIIAGGQSLIPMMNLRVARPSVLIDINGLAELNYHRIDGSDIRIGALARHADLYSSPVIAQFCPLMAEAYKHVAHEAVRTRGTLCGNLCHADPASEMPAVMLATRAEMVLRSQAGVRIVPAAEFFQGLYSTALQTEEILVEVRIPLMAANFGYSFEEMSVRKGDFAMAAVAALVACTKGKISDVALAFAGVSDRALRVPEVERILLGQSPTDMLYRQAAAEALARIDVSQDINADSEYRQDLVRALTFRALSAAVARAG